MLFMPHDAYVGRSFDLYGEFSEHEIDVLLQLVGPGDVIVDAGANIGALAVPLAARLGPTGGVIAFEPQRVLHQVLCANVALNGLTNVLTECCALGDRDGTVRLPALDYGRPNNFGGVSVHAGEGGVTVALRRLDSFGLSRCNLLKLDVEGFELAVLRGADATLRRHRPVIYAENDRAENSPALLAHLLALDYQLFWHLPPLFNDANFKGARDNVYPGTISVNVLGIPAERGKRVTGFEPVIDAQDSWPAARERLRAKKNAGRS